MTKGVEDDEAVEEMEEDLEISEAASPHRNISRVRDNGSVISSTYRQENNTGGNISRLDDRIDAKIRGAPAATTPGAIRSTTPPSSKGNNRSAALSSTVRSNVGAVRSQAPHASNVKASGRTSAVSSSVRQSAMNSAGIVDSARIVSAAVTETHVTPNVLEPIADVEDQKLHQQVDHHSDFNISEPVNYDDCDQNMLSPDIERFESHPYADAEENNDSQHNVIEAFVPSQVVEAIGVEVMGDEEEELKEEKAKFKKRAILATICLVVVCVAVVVPVSLTVFKKSETVVNVVTTTKTPTSSPSNMPSLMPSSSPTREAFTKSIDFIATYIKTNATGLLANNSTEALTEYEDKLRTDGTAQNYALKWITDEDTLGRSLNDTLWLQRYTVALIYFSLIEKSEWTHCGREQDTCTYGDKNWLSEFNECDWYGIQCDDDNKVIRGIKKISTVGSNGHLPDEIGLLSPSLIDFFWMREDLIDGTIPDAWTMLTSLERFNLGNLNMSGTWPTTFFKNTPLINTIYLQNNEFTGPISTEIGLLKELKSFLIRGNNFNDTLPTEIGQLSKMTELEVQMNNFEGMVPTELGNLKKLTKLNLANNNFSGPFPTGLYTLNKLSYINMKSNNFTGKLSDQVALIGNSSSSAQIWDLSNNKFEGNIPKEFSQIEELRKLNLVGNLFEGEVPDEICKKTGPLVSDLLGLQVSCDSVRCTCCFPSCFPSDLLETLTELPAQMDPDLLTYWKPKPELTTWAGEDRSAQNKAISWYHYDDPRSSAGNVTNPTQRIVLALLYYATTMEDNWTNSFNFLSSDDECNWTGITCVSGNVTEINLASNGLVGFLPRELQGLTELTSLNVTNNKISGQIPTNLGMLTALNTLSLNKNDFTGVFPNEICELPGSTLFQVDHAEVDCKDSCCDSC
eukprot:CAMPEP_0197827528 /NCGR_PEP_ID=MMETSP1437-20131217/4268_1 /TAXON_ID=49252 ORGANISM="Eucampia antarctica, Strain CCMP1452" /NCGR_SAMPLE_ID=MMETSP1437 /ASSEMBLY_ACC=CAM_ASM_001096 /LENGTH=908 /DNA_ID=CAMNT_0043428387 /DNA_START=183 /DNA_END=2909 /DNA_ORIENTATION=+